MARYSKKKSKKSPPQRPSAPQKIDRKRPYAKRKQWTDGQMEAAIKAVLDSSAESINAAAWDYGVPATTLKNRLSGRVVHGTNPGPMPYLSSKEEERLVEYLLDANKVGYGKTRRQVKVIVDRVATEKGVLRSARISDGWWRRFLQRHPRLSLRSGDSTGYVRMNAMNKENLKSYFDLLETVLHDNNLKVHPEQVYNMDETGIPLNPRPPKVVALRGQKKVRYQCSGSKNQITVLGCCSGTGQVIPPFVIFDAKHLNHLWTRGEVSGTRYGVSDSGWTNRELFYGWLEEHFLVHAIPARPLLLLVDGHSSHYDPDSIHFARDHSVIIFCLPPHTTHEAQPLDVSFFGPLKKHWSCVCHDFIQSSPGKAITRFNFSELFSQAWLKTCLPQTICSGFERAGIIPFNPDRLLKQCPGTEGAVEIRRKKNACQNDEELSDAGNFSCSSSGIQDKDSFSPEKEELFSHRFEEDYDVYDDEYVSWLRVRHPEAVPTSVVQFFPDTPAVASDDENPSLLSSPLPTGSSRNSPVLSPETPTPVGSISPPCSSPTMLIPHTPVASCSSSSTPKRSPLATITNCPSSSTPKSSVTILSKHLSPVAVPVKEVKTGKARVLTSRECIEMLDEKRRKKEREATEKEERKKERERKKTEKEELARRKKEAQLERKKKKAAASKENMEVTVKKVTRAVSACNTRSSVAKSGRTTSESSVDPLPVPTLSHCATPAAPVSPSAVLPGPSSPLTSDVDEEESYECSFCYYAYCDDGKEWLKCTCGRWVHEQCMEDVILDDQGLERFCPFCINSAWKR